MPLSVMLLYGFSIGMLLVITCLVFFTALEQYLSTRSRRDAWKAILAPLWPLLIFPFAWVAVKSVSRGMVVFARGTVQLFKDAFKKEERND